MKFADEVAAFLVGVLRDGAAVDDANIGFVVGSHAHETALLERTGDGGTLRKVELAAQRMKTYSTFLHNSSMNLAATTGVAY